MAHSTSLGRRIQVSFGGLALLLTASCSDPRGEFIGPRVLDQCSGGWPVCSTLVGCILGPESYIQGALPQAFGFIAHLDEPSTVRVHILLDNATAAGTLTTLTWNEPGCTSHIQTQVTGQVLLEESQRQGEFIRDGLLQGLGDHLIQVDSDARASYLLKVDILSARTQ